jgi:ligand-binding sensor domain-containing protein/signal transduction histidine kinase
LKKISKYNHLVISVVLLCFSLSVRGQLPQFHHYAVEDGVSQSAIICIFQDSEGFIWIGTQNGLNKYDGYKFENFYNDPGDANTISNSWIFDITEDQIGDIWIGTKGGLNRFDKKTGRFSLIDIPSENNRSNNSFVYGVTSDDSSIFIHQPPLLTILNYRTGSMKSYKNSFEADEALYDFGYPIMKDQNGMLWMGSRTGLASFDPDKEKFQNYVQSETDQNAISHNHITALNEDRVGNILVGTEDGFNVLNPETGQFIQYHSELNRTGDLSHDHITSIALDYSSTIWIGTLGGGLNKMVTNTITGVAEFTNFRSGPDNTGYINHDIVLCLCEDYSNNLWIGTLAGIDKTDLKKKSIRIYNKSDNPNSIELLDNIIASIYIDKEERIWVGTWGKGLSILNRETMEVTNYTAESVGEMNIPENHVHVIFEDSKGRIWLGTRNGMAIYDEFSGTFIPAGSYLQIRGFDFFNNKRVYCMIEDQGGNIWAGTGNGIFIVNPETKSTSEIRAGGDSLMSVSNNLIYSLLEDGNGDIWIATSNGLNRFDPGENRIHMYFRDPVSSNTLCDNYTISLSEDTDGNIWIGTSTGVNKFSKKDTVYSWYNIAHGLPSNVVYDIIKDGNGNIWFSTGGGLAMKNPDDAAEEPFLIIDELRGREFNIKAVFRADDGEMFFGGIDGMVSFYPDSLKENTFIPPVRITSFEKESGGEKEKINVYNEKILLSYKDYSFTIEFSALDYTDPSKNLYSYQMEGISDRWIEIGNRHFVHFTNLSPGKYTFRVKGTNNDGVWNTEGVNMRITIQPPWWSSIYAYLAYVILIIIMILIFVKVRERNLIREKRVLEEGITARTAEIAQQKDELEELNVTKDRFFSILAHDLKNPFSSLHSMSGLVSENYKDLEEDEKLKMLQNIHKSAELIFNLLENLLTWSKSQRGRIEFTPSSFNLSKLIEVNLNLHQIPAEKKGIIISADIEEELLAYGDREMINTVVRNLVNNAVKFCRKDDEIKIRVNKVGKKHEVVVGDSGIGISAQDLKKLFRIDEKYKIKGTAGETGTGLGLVLCKEFVVKNGGEIRVSSVKGSGSEFIFTIPEFIPGDA